jgi:hypothetical protein
MVLGSVWQLPRAQAFNPFSATSSDTMVHRETPHDPFSLNTVTSAKEFGLIHSRNPGLVSDSLCSANNAYVMTYEVVEPSITPGDTN